MKFKYLKLKTLIFLVSQVLSFRLKKQNSKNFADKTFKNMTLRSASRFSKSCKKFRSYKNIGFFFYKLSPSQFLCLLGNTVCNFKIHSFSFCFLLNVINASSGPHAVLPLSSFSKIRNIHRAFLMMMMMMMMMMIINCFCGMVDQQNGFSLISN